MGQYPPAHNAGGEWAAHGMLRALAARGHRVQVWLARYGPGSDPYRLDGVEVIPFRARLDFAEASREADVLLAQYELVPSTGALARGWGKPLVVPVHTTRPPTLKNLVAGQVSLAVYNSEWVRREAEVFLAEYPGGLRPAAHLVVRPPVAAAEYATTPGDHVTLVNCAVEKGGEVFRHLARHLPDAKFLAVRGAYGKQVDMAGLPNVTVLDHVPGDRMRDEVYARSRVVVMPSAYESWGRVAVEAMSSGIPVVASPTPGLTEACGGAGIFVEPGDLDGWVHTVGALLSDDAAWTAASGRARARAAELDPAADLAAFCAAVEALA